MTRPQDISLAVADRRHMALVLEIGAEAARNPRVRAIVLASQRRAHASHHGAAAEARHRLTKERRVLRSSA